MSFQTPLHSLWLLLLDPIKAINVQIMCCFKGVDVVKTLKLKRFWVFRIIRLRYQKDLKISKFWILNF